MVGTYTTRYLGHLTPKDWTKRIMGDVRVDVESDIWAGVVAGNAAKTSPKEIGELRKAVDGYLAWCMRSVYALHFFI
jgi:hypothetical protein